MYFPLDTGERSVISPTARCAQTANDRGRGAPVALACVPCDGRAAHSSSYFILLAKKSKGKETDFLQLCFPDLLVFQSCMTQAASRIQCKCREFNFL